MTLTPTSNPVANRRKLIEATQALVRTSSPSIEQIKDAIVALNSVINDVTEVPVRLDLNIVGE